jgi:hypothetical protein
MALADTSYQRTHKRRRNLASHRILQRQAAHFRYNGARVQANTSCDCMSSPKIRLIYIWQQSSFGQPIILPDAYSAPLISMISMGKPVAAVLTKPPVSIAIYYSGKDQDFYIFDSHTRNAKVSAQFCYTLTCRVLTLHKSMVFSC